MFVRQKGPAARFHSWLLRAAAYWLGIIPLGCGDEVTAPGRPVGRLPELPDAIPYEALGAGKLSFWRIGPYPGYYSGLYVVDLDSRSSRAISLGGVTIEPSLSPDGERIAFLSFVDTVQWDAVFVLALGGGEISLVAPRALGLNWSPDGDRLYFWSFARQASACSPYELVSVRPVAGGPDRQQLAVLEVAIVDRISVAPSGAVAFAGTVEPCGDAPTAGIHVIDRPGAQPRVIAEGVRLGSPAWSPDGTRLAYLDLSTRDSMAVVVVNADGSGAVPVVKLSAGENRWLIGGDPALVWSPDGTKLLFSRPEREYVAHLYVVNSDGTGLTPVTTARGVTDSSPSWSP